MTADRTLHARFRGAPDVSVVLCTYNRAASLDEALSRLQDQLLPEGRSFELLVIDNNSNDSTPEVVEARAAGDARVRYHREPRQGLSRARNLGISLARADLLAFTDDDVRVASDWIASILRAADEWPAADAFGGRVLPSWSDVPPSWLTRAHWAPLALADHGDRPFRVDAARPICLLGASLAVRRRAFERAGTFDTALQRVAHGIGSIEDHEFLHRLIAAGGHGIYDPRILVEAAVQPERLRRAYHRRWHYGHGRFHAEWSRRGPSRRERLVLGVPRHYYRDAACHALGWAASSLTGRRAAAFAHGNELCFLFGFAFGRGPAGEAADRTSWGARASRALGPHGPAAR